MNTTTRNLRIAVLVCLSLSCPARLQGQAVEDPFRQQLQPMIEQVMTQQEVPGFAIAVVRDQKIVYAAGFGVRNIDNKNDGIISLLATRAAILVSSAIC